MFLNDIGIDKIKNSDVNSLPYEDPDYSTTAQCLCAQTRYKAKSTSYIQNMGGCFGKLLLHEDFG